MSKVVKNKTKTVKRTPLESPFNIYWNKTNYMLFGLGVVMSIIGYYLLSVKPWDSHASLVLSPIILFVAYALVFPAAIFYKAKQTAEEVQ